MSSVLPILLMLLYSAAIFANQPPYDKGIYNANVVRFKANESIKFSCEIPTLGNECVEWLKNGVALPASDRVVFGNCGHHYTVTIKKAIREDAGHYSCGVFEDTYSQTFDQTVLITDLHVNLPKDVIVYAGSDLDVECEVAGIPMPTIYWHHNSQDSAVIITASEGRYILSPLNGNDNAKLILKNITKEEAGNLTCIVDSPYLTQPEETKCQVHVIVPTVPWWAIVLLISAFLTCFYVIYKTKDTCRMDPRNRAPSPVRKVQFSESTSSSEEEFIRRNKDKIDAHKKILAMERQKQEALKAKKEPDADSGMFNLSVDGENCDTD